MVRGRRHSCRSRRAGTALLLVALILGVAAASVAAARSRKLTDQAPAGKGTHPSHKPGERIAESREEHIPFDPALEEHERHLHSRHNHGSHKFAHGNHHDPTQPEAEGEHDGYADVDEWPEGEEDDGHGHDVEGDFEDFEESEEFGENDHVDVSERMKVLFPVIDLDNSGKINQSEMIWWHTGTATRNAHRRAKREFEGSDLDHNGAVTFREYWNHDEEASKLDEEGAKVPEWMLPSKKHFDIADRDKSGDLNFEEFFEFLHPEESVDPLMQAALAEEELSLRDHDEDSRLSLEEFTDTMLYELDGWPEGEDGKRDSESTDPHDPDPRMAKRKFDLLDTDKSGFIEAAELLPVLSKLRPSEHNYAHDQGLRLIQESDDDGDAELTLAEMENHITSFYHTAYDYEQESGHDEL